MVDRESSVANERELNLRVLRLIRDVLDYLPSRADGNVNRDDLRFEVSRRIELLLAVEAESNGSGTNYCDVYVVACKRVAA